MRELAMNNSSKTGTKGDNHYSAINTKEAYEQAIRLYHSCENCKRYQEGKCESDVPFGMDGCYLFEYGDGFDCPLSDEQNRV